MNANAPGTLCQLHHLLRMLQRNSTRYRPSRGRRGIPVEHFCGLDCYERFRARARPRQNLAIAPVTAVRSRQIEAYLT